MASTIFASGLSVDLMDTLDDMDEFMSDIFEEKRVDRFIRIYQASNMKLLYANDFGQMASLPLPIVSAPNSKKLRTLDYGHRKFRVLEVRNGPIVLQIALIMDSFLSRTKLLKKNIIVFSGGLLMIILLITGLSLRALLRPLRILGHDFAQWSQNLSLDFSPMQSSTDQLVHKIQERRKDWKGGEIREFLEQLYGFIKNLSQFLHFSQKQYSVLAHELKTPLTIVRNDLEELKLKHSDASLSEDISKIESEIDELSRLIQNFLDWSQQAAAAAKPNELYALKLSQTIEVEARRLGALYDNKIQIEKKNDLQLFCSPHHIQQLVSNLLKNACVHGPSEGLVTVRIEDSHLDIIDQGAGLPTGILKNLGAPFNRHNKSSGHGLGLAWVKTICDIYEWQMSFEKTDGGHRVRIDFGLQAAEVIPIG